MGPDLAIRTERNTTLAICTECNTTRAEYQRLAGEYGELLQAAYANGLENRNCSNGLREADAKGTEMLSALAKYEEALHRFSQFTTAYL